MKRLFAVLLCAVMLFSACRSSAPAKGKIIRYDIPWEITTLDPQFAADSYSRMIISNIYEGLVAYGENGELAMGVAEDFSVSPDGRTLLFKLRDNAEWKDGRPVTANDFVFAFRRMFSPESPSPFAGDYLAIENAAQVMESTAPPSALGVSAVSDYELEITLEHSSPFFPELLAETPAMPCNQEFFTEARGRYGLDKGLVSSNGPFYLDRWDNEAAAIRLLPNSHYVSEKPLSAGGVNFKISLEESALQRLLDGVADIAEISFDDLEKAKTANCSTTEFENTVWCVVFNESSNIWGNPLLRQGLARAVEQELLRENLPKKLTPASLLIPPSNILASVKYRSIANASPVRFDPVEGLRLFEMGLSSLSIDSVPEAVFYVPDSPEHTLAMGMVQQSWQKHLAAYVTIQPVPIEDIGQRFQDRDYEIMLMPVTTTTPFATDMLAKFESTSKENRFGYQSSVYDLRLSEIMRAETLTQAGEAAALAESVLLHDAVVIPVYFETTVFATAPGLIGIAATPFPSSLNFKYIER